MAAPIPAEELRAAVDPARAWLAGEADRPARAVVTTTDPEAVRATAEWAGVAVTELGTTGGDGLAVDGVGELPLAELRAAWTVTLPALFGSPEAAVGTVPAGTVPTS